MSLSVGKRTKSAGDFFFSTVLFLHSLNHNICSIKNHAVLVGTVKKDALFATNYKK